MQELKVEAGKIKAGMFVCRLDRPWLETPFLMQGFYVRTEKEISELRKHCEHVFIDTAAPPPADDSVKLKAVDTTDKRLALPKRVVEYKDKKPVEEEMARARHLRTDISVTVEELMTSVRENKSVDAEAAKTVVSKMTNSILSNPDAFMWLRLLKEKDQYTYAHSMDCSALAIAFGRAMGLPRAQLDDLGIGTLMFDVGKMRLPAELLNKPGKLTEQEFEIAKNHVAYSVEIMRESGGFSTHAIEIAECHHERFNGTGYPKGLAGGDIPLLARMASIVDTYDAITSETTYRSPISASEAARRLYEWRGNLFQNELVEQFIQTLGTYPTGSIVELNTGEVGVVISQNRVRRLRPKLMLIMNADKTRCGISPIVDLNVENEDKNGNPLEIVTVHEPGAFDIDPRELYL